MTWDINNFATLSRYHEGGTVTFRDDAKGKIIGIGNVKECCYNKLAQENTHTLSFFKIRFLFWLIDLGA